MLGVHVASLRLPLTSSLVKLRANALDLSTVQALNMLSSTSWAHLNTLLRGVERCWVLLSQIWNWSNFSLNTAQHFLCFAVIHAQQLEVEVHLYSNAQHVEPMHAQCPAYPKIAMVHSHHSLVDCSVLDHELFPYVVVASFTASTPNPRSCFTVDHHKHLGITVSETILGSTNIHA